MSGPTTPGPTERPIVVRAAILLFGLIIVVSTVRRWMSVPADTDEPVPIWIFVIPLVLASSMLLQFFAKRRGSPILLVSLGIILVSLGLLGLLSYGYLG